MKIGDYFTSRLHEIIMKPAGFKKKSHTFSRSHDGYEEHYNIRGSAWNSAETPWTFYINCGISFPDVPLRRSGTGMWKYHAHSRLRLFVPEAPGQYSVSNHDIEAVHTEVGAALMKCSKYFARRHGFLKDSYVNERYDSGFLLDPELKNRLTIQSS